MEYMTGLKRTHYCGDLRISDVGSEVVVCGWVQRCRDLGKLIFIDLRDRTGIVQLAFNDQTDKEIFDKAFACRSEFVLAAKGTVCERSAKNSDIPTGDIEVVVTDLRVLSKAQTPPFEIVDDLNTNEELRLKFRYLDLRRRPLLNNIMLRSKISKVARDYLVPSRIHNGKFYALPQSPQIYKQLLMVAGFDRYIQLARCFRDEDLRADRQPEFTQIDMELSFVDVEDILAVNEGLFKRLFKDVLGKELPTPFRRMTYTEAMENFTSSMAGMPCGFGVFTGAIANGGSVRAIVAKNAASVYTRKEIDKLTEYVKGIGAKGLAYVRWVDEPNASFKKFMTEDELNAIYERLGAEKGDVILIVADKNSTVLSTLGALRLKIAKRLNIIPDEFSFLWIVDFPFFEKDEETGEWLAMHHPFTMPKEECIQYLDTDPSKVIAKAFDLTLNGVELSSGSMRITNPELQQKMFRALKLTDEEIEAKFGFLVEAYKYGAPPHGGMGIGLDRVTMLLCGTDSLRDVTAFPKVQNASELMSACPAPVDKESLDVLGIAVKNTEE